MSNKCYECDSEMNEVRRVEPVNIRGEKIEVVFEYLQCPSCGEEYEVKRPDYDPLNEAYRIYRNRKDLLQPEEIRNFRESLKLSQHEMSAALGISVSALDQYENGALQTEAMDKAIRYYMEDRQRLMRRVRRRPELSKEKNAMRYPI